jgi:hypothetical protein
MPKTKQKATSQTDKIGTVTGLPIPSAANKPRRGTVLLMSLLHSSHRSFVALFVLPPADMMYLYLSGYSFLNIE